MKKKKILTCIICILLCLSLSSCVFVPEKRDIAENEIKILQSGDVKYSEGTKSGAVERLSELFRNIEISLGGSGKQMPRLTNAICDAVNALEDRNISERELSKALELLCVNEELLVKLFSGSAEPSEGIAIFGELSFLIGVDKTSRLFYDFSLIYCEYMEQKYRDLYDGFTSKPQYLLRNAEEWRANYDGLTRIGEDNFACVLRTGVGSATSFSQLGEISSSDFSEQIGAVAIVLYMRAQGELLSKLTLTTENFEFLIDFIGGFNISSTVLAVSSAGKSKAFAEKLQDFLNILTSSLKEATLDDARLLKNGNASEFLHSVAMSLSESERKAVEEFFASAGDGEAYISYFEKYKLDDEFADFCAKTESVTAEELWNSSKDEFLKKLEGYLATVAPAIAFTVYGYDKG